MSSRKGNKREREAIAEPMETEQASIQQFPAESSRARVWQMHLRGVPKTRIAEAVGINRETVATIITKCYREIAPEQKISPARKLREAVARMRLVQEQAWDDHDADDEREQSVLALSLTQAQTSKVQQSSEDDQPRKGKESAVSIRYQSQRSQYLRIILDAEKEIARLEGLYEGLLDVEGAGAVFRITKLSQEAVSALSAANSKRLPPVSDGEGGDA